MRFPGINLLKALAALFIMWGHTSQECFGQWQGSVHQVPVPAECVTLFFVISGFLAAFNAKDMSCRKDVKLYYCKRSKRLFPLYYAYIFVAIIAFVAINRADEIINPNLWFYLLPAGEIPFCNGTGTLPLVHLWYIGAVTLLFLVFPLFNMTNKNKKIIIGIVIFAAWNLLKLLIYFTVGKGFLYKIFGVVRADSFFLGAAVAILFKHGNKKLTYMTGNKGFQVIIWGLFIFSDLYGSCIPAPARNLYFSILYSMLVLCVLPERLENNKCGKVFGYMGQISYGIYVWHPLVIILVSDLLRQNDFYPSSAFANVLIYVVITAISICLAGLTNKLIENTIAKKHQIGLHTQ